MLSHNSLYIYNGNYTITIANYIIIYIVKRKFLQDRSRLIVYRDFKFLIQQFLLVYHKLPAKETPLALYY